MALTGVLVLGLAAFVLLLAVGGVIALLSRGEALPAITAIIVLACLLCAGVGLFAYRSLALVPAPVAAPIPPAPPVPLAVPDRPIPIEVRPAEGVPATETPAANPTPNDAQGNFGAKPTDENSKEARPAKVEPPAGEPTKSPPQ